MLFFIFLLASLFSSAQPDELRPEKRYRFSIGIGFQSFIYWGTNVLEDASNPECYIQMYQTENYKLDYKNFNTSKMFNMNAGVNWINSEKYILHQGFSVFFGNFSDRYKLTITDIGNGIPAYYPIDGYTTANTAIGSEGALIYEGEIGGIATSVNVKKKLNNGFALGAGTYVSYLGSHDIKDWQVQGYAPFYDYRGSALSSTIQLGISGNFSWTFNFLQLYLNLGQNILTLKAENKKGNTYYKTGKLGFSHNFDYRFPLTFEAGISLSFDQIKNN